MFRKLMLLPLTFALVTAFPVSAAADFGFNSFDVTFSNQDGSPDTQAGSHPFQMTTSFMLNTTTNSGGEILVDGDIKDVNVDLPPGLVGSATAVPQCSQELLTTYKPAFSGYNTSSCPDASAVGFAGVTQTVAPIPIYVPVYSIAPPPGVPAEFGFEFAGVPVVLIPAVRTGGDYGITVQSKNTSQGVPVMASTVTIWGVPADPLHDALRGRCLGIFAESEGKCPAKVAAKPLLTLPSSCGGPLTTTIEADSWQSPGQYVEAKSVSHDSRGNPVGIDGCNLLNFNPSLSVQPDTVKASSPAGLEVDLRLPQSENPQGLAEADVRKVMMLLPQGMSVSPSSANGLEACSEEEVELRTAAPARCPNASKVGSVRVESPLIERPLEGSVYVAQQEHNPFGSLLALYVVAEGSGVAVKLAGRVEADPVTGRLTTRFEELSAQKLFVPQLPFSDLKLTLFAGPRAALVTPQTCGSYQATGLLTPWSSETETPVPVASEPAFQIDTNCTSQFNPSFSAGMTNAQAGSFGTLTTSFSRSDQDQDLKEITVEAPLGLAGMLSKIQLCGEPQAAQGECPAVSQIGHVTASAGTGPDPIFLPQPGRREDPVYLTSPYKGAPFGLSVVDYAEAGPFNLGRVIVRAAVSVDPHTAQVIVKSDPLPQILEGIPLQLRSVNVVVDREGFAFNPTNCEPMSFTGTAISTQGTSAALSSHFQVANCATLPFNPKFTVSTKAKTSRQKGASLDVKVAYPKGTEANIRKVAVDLPGDLPSRITTIQKACLAEVFAVNPASCPAASNVGTATAITPILSVPLTGPAYLVSYGNAAFPQLVVILQGEGIKLELAGQLFIDKHGVTKSTFNTVPDAPVSSFELKFPQGPTSALTTAHLPLKAHGSLCHTRLVIPTTITAQNGAVIKQSTRIAVTGCHKHKKS